MTLHRPLTLALAVAVTATSGCAAIQRRLHLGQYARQTQARPVASLDSAGSANSAVDGYYDAAAKAILRRDYADALDLLQEARAHKADDVRVLNAFGVIYDKLGRYDLSSRYYAQARALDPGSAIIANNMAYSLVMQQRSSAQTQPLLTALAVEPDPIFRVASSLRTRPVDVGLQITGPGAAEAVAARGVAPLLIAAAPPPLLQRVSFTNRTPAVGPVGLAPSLVAAAVAPPPPAKPRLIAVAPGVMRLEAGGPTGAVSIPARGAPIMLARGGPLPAHSGLMLTGHPLTIVDASGSSDGAQRVRQTLAGRGWTIQIASTAPRTSQTVIRYDRDNLPIAQGLARSLPMPVRLAECMDACSGVRLIVGADAVAFNLKATVHHADRRRTAHA
jgi:hypothetical protein